MKKTKMTLIERLEWLDKQIEVQQDALTWCSNTEMYTHAYLLKRLTDEWCEKYAKLTEAEEELYLTRKGYAA